MILTVMMVMISMNMTMLMSRMIISEMIMRMITTKMMTKRIVMKIMMIMVNTLLSMSTKSKIQVVVMMIKVGKDEGKMASRVVWLIKKSGRCLLDLTDNCTLLL